MKLQKVNYDDLKPKQQEQYNFHKVSGKLAEYGYNCIRLSDDWQGADFFAFRIDGSNPLKVQLRSRTMISRKYQGKDILMCLPIGYHPVRGWYLVPHDKLAEIVGSHTTWPEIDSWVKGGQYSSHNPSAGLRKALMPYRID